MCGGGGGKAAREANEAAQRRYEEQLAFDMMMYDEANAKEEARLHGISSNMGLINNLFGGLSFDEYGNAIYDINRSNIEDQRGDADRELRFRLARAGLSGGSVEGDKEAAMQKRHGEAIAEARDYADSAEAQLLSQAQGLQGQYSSLAATGAPVNSSSIVNAIQGLQGTAPAINPATQDAFSGIYEKIGNYLSGLGIAGPNPLATANEFSSFKPYNPRQNVAGTVQGK